MRDARLVQKTIQEDLQAGKAISNALQTSIKTSKVRLITQVCTLEDTRNAGLRGEISF